MAISTSYTVTDDIVEGGIADVTLSGSYDGEQDCFVVTLNQDGNEVAMSDAMLKELLPLIHQMIAKK